jgi:hypothetical protein
MTNSFSRRSFFKCGVPAGAAILSPGFAINLFSDKPKSLKTAGVVLTVDELSTLDWPRLARDAGLTTIGTHVTPSQVTAFIRSDKGQKFLEDCTQYNLQVEHELHAMSDLLPRSLFKNNPQMFRMNEAGVRTPDSNCCANSTEALDLIAENAVKYAEVLKSTTGRYFYWIDDGAPMCSCEKCRELSPSEQALIIENAIIKALKKTIPNASLAHLAYITTMEPPVNVKPEEGIFLEFAPIYRSWSKPLTDKTALPDINIPANGEQITHDKTTQLLKKNLKVFPVSTAQVLEYWLDVSLQSHWQKPAVQLAWSADVCKSDVKTYVEMGITHITSFAAYVDNAYKEKYGDISFVNEYGRILNEYAVRRQ